jgi:excisionase family DNA binding protein
LSSGVQAAICASIDDYEVLPMDTQNTNAMTIAQFCVWAGIARSTVYKEITSGRLTARKIGHKTIIARDDAEAWFSALPTLESRAS